MGGAYVFPGGRVDAADHDGDRGVVRWPRAREVAAPGSADEDVAVAYHVAAARELFEEAGVLLARERRTAQFVSLAGDEMHARFKSVSRATSTAVETTLRAVVERERLRLALDTLVLFAHWVTPPIDTRQFDTRFFMTRVPPIRRRRTTRPKPRTAVWMTPAGAIDAIASARHRPAAADLERRSASSSGSRAVDERSLGARTQRRRAAAAAARAGRRAAAGDPGRSAASRTRPSARLPLETRFVFVDRRWRAVRRA